MQGTHELQVLDSNGKQLTRDSIDIAYPIGYYEPMNRIERSEEFVTWLERFYYTRREAVVYLLLLGGDKSSQAREGDVDGVEQDRRSAEITREDAVEAQS